MSAQTQPISAERFAAALPDLPLSSLHAKAAELQNSVLHLQKSNTQLEQYAAEGDADCAEAIRENDVVIERQRERVELLKTEVERRGFKWAPELDNGTDESGVGIRVEPDGAENGEQANGAAVNEAAQNVERGQGCRLNDEELARRLAEQMGEDEGMHL